MEYYYCHHYIIIIIIIIIVVVVVVVVVKCILYTWFADQDLHQIRYITLVSITQYINISILSYMYDVDIMIEKLQNAFPCYIAWSKHAES